MSRGGLVLAVLLIGAWVTACGSGRAPAEPDQPKGVRDDPVIDQIRASSDCDRLQELFDVADEAHAFASENDALDAMEAMSARMTAANDRMQSIGCYD